MSTLITVSAFKSEVISGDISGLFDGVSDAQFLALLNQSLINKHEELQRDCPSAYAGHGTLTFASDSYEIDLPNDCDPNETKEVLLFTDTNRETDVILQSDVYRRFGGKLRFNAQQKKGQTYEVEYTSEPNEYDDIEDSFEESVNRRSKKYLAYEIRKLYYDALRNNEPSAAGNKLRVDSNDIS